MGKNKRKKTATGFLRLLSRGILKVLPLFVGGAIGFGIFWGIRENLYADPAFLIRTVEVVSPKSVSPQKIEELERLYLNRNLFKVSPRQTALQVEQDPRIRQARVIRAFPNTLRVEILDRDVFGQVQYDPKGAYYTVAEDGMVLGSYPSRHGQLVLIEVFETEDVKPQIGKKLFLPGLGQAVALTRAFKKHSLGRSETIERIRLNHLGDVALVLEKGPELRFGRDPMKKWGNLDSLLPLLKGPERSRIIYIELQYQDLIVKKK